MNFKFKDNIIRLRSTESTNDYAFAEGKKCAVTAEFQTKGRGRVGRSFTADKGQSLLLSVLENSIISPCLTAMTAVCVHKSIKKLCNINCEIKWPNDIIAEGKKLCGILTEMREENVVIGIGINLYQEDFGDLRSIATSVKLCGAYIDKETLMLDILDNLDEMINNFNKVKADFLDYYTKNCSTINRNVWLIKGDKKTPAFAAGVNDSFELIVKYENGETDTVFTGEISVRTTG